MEENRKKALGKMGIFLAIVTLIGIGYFLYYLFFLKGYEETENAYIHGNKIAVTAQSGGVIQKISVQNTQKVKQGDMVIEIDPFNYQVALKNAEAKLGDAVRNYYLSQKNVTVGKENVQSALDNLKLAEKTLAREKITYDAGVTSAENYDRAKTAYLQAKTSYETAKTSLQMSKLKAKSNNVKSYPAVVSAIENYKQAYSNYQKTKIYAPISGTVAQKQVDIGQEIRAGQTLFTIVDLDNVWVEANFKETQLKHIRPGNIVEMESDVNGKIYKGVVVGLAAGSGNAFSLIPAQNATGNWIKIVQRVPVRIKISKKSLQENGLLPLETSLTVKVNTNQSEKVSDISEQAVSELYRIDEQQIDEAVDTIIKNNSL